MEKLAPGLRMLSVSRVVPVAAPAENASNVKVKLSFLDAQWLATPPVQEVFLYERVGNGSSDEFRAAVERLKESLAASLSLYLPLAGKLAHVEETSRDIVVDCSQPGVDFFEVEAVAGCMDIQRLVKDVSEREVASLVPEHDARVLPAPVFVVQVTRLNGAGLALGVSVHHAAVDGRAFNQFLEKWASISRLGLPTVKSVAPPDYTREAIVNAHPSGDELARHVLNKVAPNLPLANASTTEDYFTQHSRLRRHTFILGSDDIRTLRGHIDGLALSAGLTRAKPVSTFVALSALSWIGFVHAKGLTAGEDTHLLFQVDLCGRLRPPVSVNYFGNCVRGCIASADAGELQGKDGLLRASQAIQAAVKEVLVAPLAMEAWMERVMRLPIGRQANVGGSPMFGVYKTTDFGFDMPAKVVPLSMAGSPETPAGHHVEAVHMDHEGRIVFSGGKKDGEVHLSMTLDPEFMDAFKNYINTPVIRSKF